MGEWIEPGKERYGLNWPGKAECMRVIQTPSIGTLRPRRDQSVSFDATDNLIIEGDNLEVLKLLQKSYYGKVKMIYIDPPYNTGKEFIYPDNYREGLQDYLKFSGQLDAAGLKVSANTETSGRYHSKWLSMMYPRLYLARNLLRDDGVIFVSIDDCEAHNLRCLANEVFGEENFVDSIVWKKRYGGGAKEKYLVTIHEYVLMYARNKTDIEELFVPLSDESIERYYKNRDEYYALRGPFRTHPLESMKSFEERRNLVFPIQAPDGTQVMPKRQWRWSKERVAHALNRGELAFLKDKNGEWAVHTKQYLKDQGETRQTKFFSVIDDVYTQHGTNEIIEIFGDAQVFGFPKPSRLVRKLVGLATDTNDGDLILDFFAGSGTTAQAVLDLNVEDGGDRKFILVQLPEKTEHPQYPTIADICRERVRRVIQKLDTEDAAKDSLGLDKRQPRGYKALQLTSSNFHVWDGDAEKIKNIEDQLKLFAQHVEPGRTDEDLLYEILPKGGFTIDSHIEKLSLAGKVVFSVADGALLLCLDRELTLEVIEAMVNRVPAPAQIICLDAGFQGNDQLKVNAVQTVKSRNRLKEGDLVFQVV
ncbi:MAG TPA: site-specific DNA-methyltransferase [Candidatus Binatia bacterium]